MSWRQEAEAVARETLRELPADATVEQAKKALSKAYPFGQRAMHPYKVWLQVVKEQLQLRFQSEREKQQERNREKLQAMMQEKGLVPHPSLFENQEEPATT